MVIASAFRSQGLEVSGQAGGLRSAQRVMGLSKYRVPLKGSLQGSGIFKRDL